MQREKNLCPAYGPKRVTNTEIHNSVRVFTILQKGNRMLLALTGNWYVPGVRIWSTHTHPNSYTIPLQKPKFSLGQDPQVIHNNAKFSAGTEPGVFPVAMAHARRVMLALAQAFQIAERLWQARVRRMHLKKYYDHHLFHGAAAVCCRLPNWCQQGRAGEGRAGRMKREGSGGVLASYQKAALAFLKEDAGVYIYVCTPAQARVHTHTHEHLQCSSVKRLLFFSAPPKLHGGHLIFLESSQSVILQTRVHTD